MNDDNLTCPKCSGKNTHCDICKGMGKVTEEEYLHWLDFQEGCG